MKNILISSCVLLLINLSVAFGQTPKSSVTNVHAKPVTSIKTTSATAASAVTTKTSSTTTVSTNTSAPPSAYSPVPATGANMSLKNLVTRALKEDSTQTTSKAGNVGVGLTYFLNGSLLVGAVLRQRSTYFTAGVGLYANKANIYSPINDVLFYGGGGLLTSRHVSIGGYLSVTMVSSPTYTAMLNSYEATTRKTPTFGLGISAGYQLAHVLISGHIHNQFGLGLGATYFF